MTEEEQKSPEPADILACLVGESVKHEVSMNKLQSDDEDEYEKIAIMINAGASETVTSSDKCPF